jgi:hypothetical protein
VVVESLKVEEDVVFLCPESAGTKDGKGAVETKAEETTQRTSMSSWSSSETFLAASSVCWICQSPVLSGVTCIL